MTKDKSMTTVAVHQFGTITVRGQYTFNGAISPAVTPPAPTPQTSTYAMIDLSVSGAKLAPQIRARVTSPPLPRRCPAKSRWAAKSRWRAALPRMPACRATPRGCRAAGGPRGSQPRSRPPGRGLGV